MSTYIIDRGQIMALLEQSIDESNLQVPIASFQTWKRSRPLPPINQTTCFQKGIIRIYKCWFHTMYSNVYIVRLVMEASQMSKTTNPQFHPYICFSWRVYKTSSGRKLFKGIKYNWFQDYGTRRCLLGRQARNSTTIAWFRYAYVDQPSLLQWSTSDATVESPSHCEGYMVIVDIKSSCRTH